MKWNGRITGGVGFIKFQRTKLNFFWSLRNTWGFFWKSIPATLNTELPVWSRYRQSTKNKSQLNRNISHEACQMLFQLSRNLKQVISWIHQGPVLPSVVPVFGMHKALLGYWNLKFTIGEIKCWGYWQRVLGTAKVLPKYCQSTAKVLLTSANFSLGKFMGKLSCA